VTITQEGSGLLEPARRIGAEIADRGEEIERERTLPGDIVDRFRDAGLFGMALPAALGGAECAPLTVIEVIEEVSRADPSAGWTLLIGQGCGFLAWLQPDVAGRLLAGTPRPVVASSMAPAGKGEETAGGCVLTGRWPFSSGCRHSDWVMAGFVPHRDGMPLSTASGVPAQRMAFLPAAEVEIVDTWRVSGLRGTGSHDITVTAVHVPTERIIDPLRQPARHPGPLYSASMFSFLMMMMSGFPLGVGRRALDEFHATAHRKRRQPSGEAMAEQPWVQAAIVSCESALAAARALVVESVRRVEEAVAAGDGVPVPVRARLSAAVLHAMTTATEVVETAFHSCGASSLYASHPLQRCFRDIHAAAAHVAFGQQARKRLGRIELGLPAPTFLV
jgi:alkylation response protein AidB-like acyl-CoA dehydrogenase